jgi:hypothetical protein
MGAYKSLTVQDIILSPFEVNKAFSFTGATTLTGSSVGIDRFLGTNITGTFNPTTDPTTGYINTGSYQRLIYQSVKHLYYSNFISSSTGDLVATSSIIFGYNDENNIRVGEVHTPNYYNYLQSTLTQSRYFPTASDSVIGVISIPQNLFGTQIQPKSFTLISDSGSLYDDGNGNLIYSNTNVVCGNIIYQHGLVLITGNTPWNGSALYDVATYGSSAYGFNNTSFIQNFISSSNITCSFSSSLIINETLFKCTLRENEFNFTQNPSAIENQTTGKMYDFITGSFFAPYITTVGLYDRNRNLLAVGKLSQPLPSSRTTDMTIYVKIDK